MSVFCSKTGVKAVSQVQHAAYGLDINIAAEEELNAESLIDTCSKADDFATHHKRWIMNYYYHKMIIIL